MYQAGDNDPPNALKIDGLSCNLNSKARERAVVIHSAEYVSFDFINQFQKNSLCK